MKENKIRVMKRFKERIFRLLKISVCPHYKKNDIMVCININDLGKKGILKEFNMTLENNSPQNFIERKISCE